MTNNEWPVSPEGMVHALLHVGVSEGLNKAQMARHFDMDRCDYYSVLRNDKSRQLGVKRFTAWLDKLGYEAVMTIRKKKEQ